MKFKEFIEKFAEKTKKQIEYWEGFQISGEGKKQRLDGTMTDWANMVLDGVSLNPVFKWVIKKLLIENIPIITQAIYDLIKTKIKGITE